MAEHDPPPPFTDLPATAPIAAQSSLTNLREQILANAATIQHVQTTKRKGQLEIITPRTGGQYIAMVVVLQDPQHYPMSIFRLFRSAQRFSMVEAMLDLSEVVADELTAAISGKVNVSSLGLPSLSGS
ncbi:hypothetical protein MBLNU457_2256t1 [Dothideomycetes sp. NU457]